MSRIYDNQPLRNLPVININFSGIWPEDSASKGNGYLIEGSIQNRAHFQVSLSNTKKQYYVFYLKISRAHRRQFTDSGQEIEPNFSETKKVSTGYLNSSYKVTAKGQTDHLKNDEIRALLRVPELQSYTEVKGEGHSLSALWCESGVCDGLEFEVGDTIRLKTKGDGPFIASIAKLDDVSSTVSNYAGGESVGGNWTDKIMDMKSTSEPTASLNDGVDEDEWDD